MRSNYSNIWL